MNKPRVVVIISTDPSDKYFANQLIKHVNVVGVFVEEQRHLSAKKSIATALPLLVSPLRLVQKICTILSQRYFARIADRIAIDGFGMDGQQLSAPAYGALTYTSGAHTINHPRYVNEIRALEPDIIAVCGASLLKEPLLAVARRAVLNLHGGLSQRYRGLWTTLWAIYNGEPQHVGFTVHFISPGIDDGEIIYQGRPVIEEGDNHETLYVKVVKAGTVAMLQAISDIEHHTITSYPLATKGPLYVNRMLTPAIISATWKKIHAGLIRDYVRGQYCENDAPSPARISVEPQP